MSSIETGAFSSSGARSDGHDAIADASEAQDARMAPDQAWPAPCTFQCSQIARPRRQGWCGYRRGLPSETEDKLARIQTAFDRAGYSYEVFDERWAYHPIRAANIDLIVETGAVAPRIHQEARMVAVR
jgi:hypothetical protein